MFLFLPFFFIQFVLADVPGKRTYEIYTTAEMGDSIRMIKKNINGARIDFYSDYGYDQKYSLDFINAIKYSNHSLHLFCEDKVYEKVYWKFELTDKTLSIKLMGDKINIASEVHIDSIKYDGNRRFFINDKNFKMKGIILKGREKSTFSLVRFVTSSGQICATVNIYHFR